MALSADSARLGATSDRILNKLAFALANKADDITTATTSDRIPMVDASADYAVKYADGANVLEMIGVTATAAELNAASDVSSRLVSITDAATYTALAANSGKTHVIPDLTADITIDLPAAASGLEYTFIGKGVAADGQNWIFDTTSATNYYLGGLAFADTDAGDTADEIHAGVYPDGNSNDIMTIVTPGAGTRIHMICDGTNWIVNGQVFSATVPTFAD